MLWFGGSVSVRVSDPTDDAYLEQNSRRRFSIDGEEITCQEVVTLLKCVSSSCHPAVQLFRAVLHPVEKRPLLFEVDHCDSSIGFQITLQSLKMCFLVLHVVESIAEEDESDRFGNSGVVFLAQDWNHLDEADLSSGILEMGDKVQIDIDGINLARFACSFGHSKGEQTCASPDIRNPLSGLDL